MLGVEPNTVNVWQRRGDSSGATFPTPIAKLAGCSIWDIRSVIAWADATGRTVMQRDYSAPGSTPAEPSPL